MGCAEFPSDLRLPVTEPADQVIEGEGRFMRWARAVELASSLWSSRRVGIVAAAMLAEARRKVRGLAVRLVEVDAERMLALGSPGSSLARDGSIR